MLTEVALILNKFMSLHLLNTFFRKLSILLFKYTEMLFTFHFNFEENLSDTFLFRIFICMLYFDKIDFSALLTSSKKGHKFYRHLRGRTKRAFVFVCNDVTFNQMKDFSGQEKQNQKIPIEPSQ